MNLAEARKTAANLSKGTSDATIKEFVERLLKKESAAGSLLDYGAGLGELLTRLHSSGGFSRLAGVDLFPRPTGLPEAIEWLQQDLNDVPKLAESYDVVVCSETIEHLENPRQVFRALYSLLKPGGLLVLTMPNQESIRSYVGPFFGGHFVHFLGALYPAHITALLRMDLQRMCGEVGLTDPTFHPSGHGGVPKMPKVKWRTISFGLARGRLFSDNIGLTARRPIS